MATSMRSARLAGFLPRRGSQSLPGRGVTALFANSGSGKTTLLRCIAGLERDAGGAAHRRWRAMAGRRTLAAAPGAAIAATCFRKPACSPIRRR